MDHRMPPGQRHAMRFDEGRRDPANLFPPDQQVRFRRLTVRHAKAFLRWLLLKSRHRNLRCGLVYIDWTAEMQIGERADITIGRGTIFRRGFTGLFHRGTIRIGERVHVSERCYFSVLGGLDIGDGAVIAEGTSIHDMDHGFGPALAGQAMPDRGLWVDPIRIGRDVWIGAHAVVTRGVTIGDDVVIAAGSVVTTDIPSHCVAGGVPARVLRSWANDVGPPPSGLAEQADGARPVPLPAEHAAEADR